MLTLHKGFAGNAEKVSGERVVSKRLKTTVVAVTFVASVALNARAEDRVSCAQNYLKRLGWKIKPAQGAGSAQTADVCGASSLESLKAPALVPPASTATKEQKEAYATLLETLVESPESVCLFQMKYAKSLQNVTNELFFGAIEADLFRFTESGSRDPLFASFATCSPDEAQGPSSAEKRTIETWQYYTLKSSLPASDIKKLVKEKCRADCLNGRNFAGLYMGAIDLFNPEQFDASYSGSEFQFGNASALKALHNPFLRCDPSEAARSPLMQKGTSSRLKTIGRAGTLQNTSERAPIHSPANYAQNFVLTDISEPLARLMQNEESSNARDPYRSLNTRLRTISAECQLPKNQSKECTLCQEMAIDASKTNGLASSSSCISTLSDETRASLSGVFDEIWQSAALGGGDSETVDAYLSELKLPDVLKKTMKRMVELSVQPLTAQSGDRTSLADVKVWVHPIGQMNLAQHAFRQLRENPLSRNELSLDPPCAVVEHYDRYKKAYLEGCSSGPQPGKPPAKAEK